MTEITTIREREAATKERIARALERDEQEQRERILTLVSEADFTVEELAAKLNLHAGLVRTRLAELRNAARVAGVVQDDAMVNRWHLRPNE
jgi:predicted ArsR family transcriptional regulator